jgi:hypothetical protein
METQTEEEFSETLTLFRVSTKTGLKKRRGREVAPPVGQDENVVLS